jgi:hypothetical protein
VAPLLALGGGAPKLIGPITLVINEGHVVGVTSAELLRPLVGTQLAIGTKLDGSAHTLIASWGMGRYSGVGLVELDGELPTNHDVVPLPIASVNASINIHGAPAALATIVASAGGYERLMVAVHVDADDAGGMSDHAIHLASPLDAAFATIAVEGAPLFAWLPADPALGRRSEVVVFALAYPYRARIAKPRETPVIAELVGLDDLGRALISVPEPEERPELGEVAGEIDD